MPPNVKGDTPGFHDATQHKDSKTKEIYYNGYFYDISNFIPRHPGGSVINFYTEPGEDATDAVRQFHYRSMNRVEAIMKSLPKRPAAPQERGLQPEALSRHDALTADFNKLFEELKSEGYFEPSIPHVIIRLVEPIALCLVGLSIFYQCETYFTKFLGTILFGFTLSRFSWVVHEGGHNSLTGRPKVDKAIQDLCMCLALGVSSIWWNSQHNRHHAMPQRLEHDVDLATLPYVAFNKKTVKDKKQINSFFVRYQAVFYWTLDVFVAYIAWKFVLHPRYQLRKKAYHEMILNIPTCFFAVYGVGIGWYFLMAYWGNFFLAVNFALSHTHLDVAEQPTHWVEYSLTHTANIKPSLFVDYFMGYLNYQIEHHLFPNMPQFRQKQICHRVKALAEKHGLAYNVYSYPEACALAVKNLHNVGAELTK